MDSSRILGYVLIHLGLLVFHTDAFRPDNFEYPRRVNKVKGEWGKWGTWSPCSVECGTGISSRTRRCVHPLTLSVSSLIRRVDDTVECEGGGREIRVCNKHRCPLNITNLREKQCRKFNARVYNGKKYLWEPYINPNNKCELTCRAKGQHFYARLANRVGDGTPCGINTLAVCIHRKCLDIGCDDMVGSNATLDKCGVCKGDNSTCRAISGIFTRRDLPHGYSQIISIPRGSTNINITELKPSTNYLSLKNNAGSILNGDWTISPSGDYDVAGTTFVYKKESQECPGECLFAPGPTNETLELMMLVYHRNPGVLYNFNVPIDVKDSYFKDLISRNAEKHPDRPLYTTSSSVTTSIPELANLQMEETAAPFREELDDNQPEQHIEDVEEGVKERPSFIQEENNVAHGDKGYTFLEAGQTVVLKANAGSWMHKMNESESQTQKGPSIVVSEQESGKRSENDSASLEVVEGDSTALGEKENSDISEEAELGDNEQASRHEEYDSEEDFETESVEENNGIGREISQEESETDIDDVTQVNDTEREQAFEEGIGEEYDKEIVIEGGENKKTFDERDEYEVGDGDDDNLDENNDDDDESYDKSRGDETMGLGDHYSVPESKPMETQTGYRLPQRADVATESMVRNSSEKEVHLFSHTKQVVVEPTSTSAATSVASTAPSSTEPQRDSRFKTYSRTLGQSGIKPTVNRNRPYSRFGIRRNNRLPKYSQSFTFRDRYRSMINAQRKQRLNRQRQQLLASRTVTRSPVVNRQIPGRQVQQRRQPYYDRSSGQSQRNRGTAPQQRHQNRHRHHHQQHSRPVITTSPTLQTPDDTTDKQSQSLHLGSKSESRIASSNEQARGSSGVGSSVTLKANIGNQGGQTSRHHSRDHRVAAGRSQSQAGGHQPSMNSRVSSQPFDRAIDPRQPPPNQTIRKTTGEKDADGRVIIDETLPLGQINRNRDRRLDRRIVVPRQPVNVPTGREVINQQPVISSRPRHDRLDTRTRNGEPLTKYSGSVDPVSGHPSLSSGNRALSGGRSYTNVIPNNDRQNTLVSSGGNSNEILGSNYVWRVSGFSDCTHTCGGGVQQTVVVCVDTRTQAVVTDENCAGLRKPTTTALTCNTRPCPASWHTTPWSSCSKTCGPGTQSRTVACKSRVSATLNLTMPEGSCTEEKPPSSQQCEVTPCYKWNTGNWSKCSTRCGEGTRQREVTCTDASDRVVTSQLCPELKPTNQEQCNLGSCGKGWYFTDWPTQCPVTCGEGKMQRKTMCAGEGGAVLDDDRCDRLSRPDTQKTCRVDTPCGGNWFIGEWSKCNSTCGYAVRERDVVCVKSVPGGILAVVTEDNCKGKDKPDTQEECDLDLCQSEWYMTSWGECSKTCGTGHKTREVKCLDTDQQPSGECSTRVKPRTREPCNTQSCVTRPKPTSATGGSCKDSFSQCRLVKKARLCRYSYYAKMCCLSCSNET